MPPLERMILKMKLIREGKRRREFRERTEKGRQRTKQNKTPKQ